MAASLVELVVPGGIETLKCPRTGMDVIVEDYGFDPDADHSPHLRFFIDWAGCIFVADPDDLPEDQAEVHRAVVAVLAGADDESVQNDVVDACRELLPASSCVFEILDPPTGSFDGEICYACFDFGDAPDARTLRLKLV